MGCQRGRRSVVHPAPAAQGPLLPRQSRPPCAAPPFDPIPFLPHPPSRPESPAAAASPACEPMPDPFSPPTSLSIDLGHEDWCTAPMASPPPSSLSQSGTYQALSPRRGLVVLTQAGLPARPMSLGGFEPPPASHRRRLLQLATASAAAALDRGGPRRPDHPT
eukprot:TRINITY_DN5184_c0_g1_i1.p1 TRINITY_DN5184_c0_g1~~TRINITY_DN5184_c0_g1_i1.p1  ORF type:complete len:187 (-),score=6.46 TRINITY_DN5184_c0_g1_i1:374-862(-)